jgi:ubiquinone/menaquinone biosynthesis C-methylase UbiE
MSSKENNENTYIIDPEHAAELVRLLAQDQCMNEAMGSLFPKQVDLTDVERVLDVACGPGGWAIEVAFRYQDIEVVGIDISELTIRYARSSAQVQKRFNVAFSMMDARKPLTFPDGDFGLVNARFMAAFLPSEEWPRVVKECARITRHGGTIVLTEADVFEAGCTNSPALEELNALCREAVRRTGLQTSITPLLDQFLQQAGCQSIQHTWHSLDFSSGTPAHEAVMSNLSYAYKLIQPLLLKMGQATQKQLDTLYMQGLGEMLLDNFCAHTRFVSVWGTRREAAAEKPYSPISFSF